MELARERTSARSPRLHALKTDDEFAEHNEAEKREGNTTGMLGRGLWASDHISRKRFVSSEAWQPEHEKPESGAEEEFDGRGVRGGSRSRGAGSAAAEAAREAEEALAFTPTVLQCEKAPDAIRVQRRKDAMLYRKTLTKVVAKELHRAKDGRARILVFKLSPVAPHTYVAVRGTGR